jgi:hypothetical protein
MSEKITKYYSPIEFAKISDIVLIPPNVNFNISMIQNKSKIIIYIWHHNDMLEYILNNIINFIAVPFVIISAMEDTTFPNEMNIQNINTIKNNINFKHWFAINKIIPNDSFFTTIPYGLDYWTVQNRDFFGETRHSSIEQDLVFSSIIENTVHFTKRINKIFANFHLHLTDIRHGGWREKISSIIPSNIIYFQNEKIIRRDSWKKMSEFSFVLSPCGNGFDCIRTLEALCLGCIVILRKCELDISMYNDLPILVVNEYNEITEELLNNTLNEYSTKKFNYEKLKMKYWINEVYNKLNI